MVKRLESLSSASSIAGAFYYAHGDDHHTGTLCFGGGSFFSLLLRGISAYSSTPNMIRQSVERCLRSVFEFVPDDHQSAVKLVNSVHFAAVNVAVVAFGSRLLAELFLEAHELGYFLGKRVSVERSSFSSRFKTADLRSRLNVVGLQGIPADWADAEKLRRYFEERLKFINSDGSKTVRRVDMIPPGAAYLDLCLKREGMDDLVTLTKVDRELLGYISKDLIMVFAKRTVQQPPAKRSYLPSASGQPEANRDILSQHGGNRKLAAMLNSVGRLGVRYRPCPALAVPLSRS